MTHSSAIGQQFHQLPMFMTAHELRNETTPGDFVASRFGVPQNAEDMWSRKLRESKEVTRVPAEWGPEWQPESIPLHESIRKNGIKSPVSVGYDARGVTTLKDGHHRVAVAASISPHYLVPVDHD